GDKMVDLGSGDGRIVIAFAKKGIEAHGYEINPILVLYSKYKIRKLKLNNAKIFWKSFWKANLDSYDIIVLFQYKSLMNKIYFKLKKELKKSAKIISYHWKFYNLDIKKKTGDVYLYSLR
ncbi:MAG: class I SAM-dependent methyltransferase, partial [Candidatus Pacearchaeota archaeon]|nr:class I SAM-dependent methyltransferase [Candidatus Pacearchaeota archaeon]